MVETTELGIDQVVAAEHIVVVFAASAGVGLGAAKEPGRCIYVSHFHDEDTFLQQARGCGLVAEVRRLVVEQEGADVQRQGR